MAVVEPCCTMLLITEDSGKQAQSVLKAMVRNLLRLAFDLEKLPRIDYQMIEDEDAREAARGNAWKASKPSRSKVALCREIATTLRMERGFVFFHFDGDEPWGKSKNGPKSENREKFEKQMRPAIEKILEENLRAQDGARREDGSRRRLRRKGKTRGTGNSTAPRVEAQRVHEEVEGCLKHLVLVVPFYSMEAWLYQHIDKAIEICKEQHFDQDVEQFKEWKADRGRLDEVCKPKKKTRLGDRYNERLAENGFPAKAVYDAGKSFAKVADDIRSCEALRSAICFSPE